MKFHLCSAELLCLLQQLHTDPTTTCAKEVKEVLQSMFCRWLTIGHTNNFLTSNQSQTTCLYLLPNPQTCQPRQAHSGIQWCPNENISRYINCFLKPLTLGSFIHTSETPPTTSIISDATPTTFQLEVSRSLLMFSPQRGHGSLGGVPHLKTEWTIKYHQRTNATWPKSS